MESIVYRLFRSKRKTVSLRLGQDGVLEVRAPMRTPKKEIDEFILSSAGWIEKQREKRRQAEESSASFGRITTEEELHAAAQRMIAVLKQKLPVYADRLGVSYGRVTVRNQKTKWGSCSSKGNLNFNVLLLFAPPEVLDYVIVHELCHRKHMDHSKEFWAMVGSCDPEYKAHRKWLKDNGAALMGVIRPEGDEEA